MTTPTPTSSAPLYFAYGSNMLEARLKARCPSARALGTAMLAGHALRWHKVGADGSGKCDVVASDLPDAAVHGVLYALSAADKPLLDAIEGLGAGYDERWVAVATPTGSARASVYVATHIDASLPPFDWYKALVLAGAQEHALPDATIGSIEAVAVRIDPDDARRALHLALARQTRL